MVDVNSRIQDRVIRHAVFLERLKNSEARRIRKIINSDVLPDVQTRLLERLLKIDQRGSDLGVMTTRRIKALEKILKAITTGMTAKIQKELETVLKELNKDELNWQAKTLNDELIKVSIDVITPDPKKVFAVTKATPFTGFTLDQWFDNLDNAAQRNFTSVIQRGVVEGLTTQQIVSSIIGTKRLNYTDGVMEVTRRQAETITRTAINHVSNQARLELFKENDDIIKGLKWVSTLDGRTSIICAGLDGKVFKIDKGPRPPIHPNCRSTMTPVLKSAQGLGLKDVPPAVRASLNGQVPENVTFGKWLKGQDTALQNKVLGVKRAQLFRSGKVSIDKFTNSKFQVLTLDELRVLEK